MKEYTVVYRQGCHLCDQMLADLASFQDVYGFQVHIKDVDGDPDLYDDYSSLVPVLLCGNEAICHYRLDRNALLAHLAR